jgi:hypothetical protein
MVFFSSEFSRKPDSGGGVRNLMEAYSCSKETGDLKQVILFESE